MPLFLAGAVSFVLSCGQKDPLFRPGEIITLPQGDIAVTASAPGAAISLDGLPTGQVTPDTLRDVRAGGHRISLFLGGYFSASESLVVVAGAVHSLHFALQPLPTVGDLAVTAAFPADILLNGISTGRTAPDTLRGLAPGSHTVALSLGGFRPQPLSRAVNIVAGEVASAAFDLIVPKHVLCEDFSNFACDPCPPVDEALQNVIARENAIEPGRLVSLNTHLYWPSNADPMFRFNPPANCSRKWVYAVQTMPVVCVDGVQVADPNETTIGDGVRARSMPTAPIAVGVAGQVSGTNYFIKVDVWGVQAGFPSPLQLTTCVVEREIVLSPPGPNGQARYVDVLRGILPAPTATCPGGPGGMSISLAVGEHQRFEFEFDYSVPGGVNPAQLAVIAFVQDLASKEVFQTGYTFEPTSGPAAGNAFRAARAGDRMPAPQHVPQSSLLGSPERSGRPVTR